MSSKALRVWWIPQVGSGDLPFVVSVHSVEEAKRALDLLAAYDLYQHRNRLRPDFSNSGGLEEYDEATGQWVEWEDPETGIQVDEV